MPLTQVRGGQVQDGSIQRVDLDVSTVGQAVIRKLIMGAGLSETHDGADTGTGDVTVSAKLNQSGGAEGWLGNPPADGYILSSSTAGVRSWIAPPSGGSTITLTGDVTGSGTTSIATAIAAGVVGSNEINNAVNLAMTAAQTIRVADTGNNVLNVLRISHNYTGTPTANAEGTALSIEGKSDTTVDRTLAQIKAQWSVVADATRTSWLDIGTVASGILSTCARFFGSNGVSINNTTDPGAGFVNVPTAGGYKINNVNILPITPTNGGLPTAGAINTILRKNSATNYDAVWDSPASTYVGSGTNPPGVSGATSKMCGYGTATYGPFLFTPSFSGKVLVIFGFGLQNNTAGATSLATLRYGTGTPPANQGTATGTSGPAYVLTAATVNAAISTSLSMVITGLTVGTQYWFDIAIASGAAGQLTSASGGYLNAVELP